MDAITLLTQRQSSPRLESPAPTGVVLDIIMQAAVRVPDHAGLKPWQFFVCEGDGLDRLGQLFLKSATENNFSERDICRAPELPKRAPMVIVATMKYKPNDKVPRVEQIASTACSVMAMQMAAQAQGFNGVWRTGKYAFCDIVKDGFGLSENDEILGFLYLGTPQVKAGIKPALDVNQYFTRW